MALLYGEAKRLFAQYAARGGVCPNADGVDLFMREVMQYLLYSGADQDLREFTFIAQKGVFTLPPEVESIQKVRVDGEVGQVWDQWFKYRSARTLDGDCLCPTKALFEEANYAASAYDLPACGGYPAIQGHCQEADDAHVIIQGKDLTGREIFTTHKGENIAGVYLSVMKDRLVYSTVKFAQITNVVKTPTVGYVTLYSYDPANGKKLFLSDYTPLEEVPQYRRYRLTNNNCCTYAKVAILARIRLKEKYADNDQIPFDSILTMRLAAQSINAQYNNDVATAQAKDASMVQMIGREAAHKRVNNGQPIEFLYPISAGTIRNIN